MTWWGVGTLAVSAAGSYYSSTKAADAAEGAANTQAASEQASLDYLQEINAVPQQYKESALNQLGGIYGLEGGTGSQQATIDQAKQSPLYQEIMGGQEAGEESILRNAAATGGLRSGNTSYNLADYNTQLSNQALLESYNQQVSGLGGLAGLSTNENTIATTMAGIGATTAEGQVAAAQAEQEGLNSVIGAVSSGLETYGKTEGFSDRRLKDNIVKIGKVDGLNWYSWDWNEEANIIGLKGSGDGVMADEVIIDHPQHVSIRDGFMYVDYKNLLGGRLDG